MTWRMTVFLLLGAGLLHGEENKSRAWQLSEVNAKIASLQKQIDYWQERKRKLLDMPDNPAAGTIREGETRTHTGPRNGKYHYSPSGHKVYVRK